MTIKLSILDQSPIIGDATSAQAVHSTIELARLADALGYHRFWLAEHHALTGLADASPEILLARIGAETKRIRIGTGGIMLPYYSAFKIAEQFRMLETLYPGRIDLGVGRAPGGHMQTARAIADGQPLDAEHGFLRKLSELWMLFDNAVPADHPFRGITVSPAGPGAPELWVLGSSPAGASIAAHMGMRFAFAHFINAYAGPGIAAAYRQNFAPGQTEKPYFALAIIALVAENAEEAAAIRKAMALRWVLTAYGQNLPVPTIEQAAGHVFDQRQQMIAQRELPRAIIGTVDEVRAHIEELQRSYEADEIVLVSMAPSYELRSRTAQALAEAFDLSAGSTPAAT